MLSDIQLEELERKYFEYFLTFLTANLNPIIEGLNSRIRIINDWYQNFTKTVRKNYKASDLDTGAERIFHHFFASILHIPNSCPLGSDLMFEVYDAFIHIEVKTALIDNPSDYKGKINIAINQTSYAVNNVFLPNLPQYYHPAPKVLKPCLTYVIMIVHEHAKPNIKALKLVCVPNGQLFNHYGKNIVRSGKSGFDKARDFRYNYFAEPHFKLLTDKYNTKKFRVELIFLAKSLKPEDITNLPEIPVHFKF